MELEIKTFMDSQKTIEDPISLLIAWQKNGVTLFELEMPIKTLEKHEPIQFVLEHQGMPTQRPFPVELYSPLFQKKTKQEWSHFWRRCVEEYFELPKSEMRFGDGEFDTRLDELIGIHCLVKHGGSKDSRLRFGKPWKETFFEEQAIPIIAQAIHLFETDDEAILEIKEKGISFSPCSTKNLREGQIYFPVLVSLVRKRIELLYESFPFISLSHRDRVVIIEKWQSMIELKFPMIDFPELPFETFRVLKTRTELSDYCLQLECPSILKCIPLDCLQKVTFDSPFRHALLEPRTSTLKKGDFVFRSKQEFSKELTELLSLAGLEENSVDWNQMTLAGGAALYLGTKCISKIPRDLDFFVLYDPENDRRNSKMAVERMMTDILSTAKSKNQECVSISEEGMITVINRSTGIQVQWIFTDCINSYWVTRSFDFDYVQCFYDGKDWCCTLDALMALQSMCIRKCVRTTRPSRYLKALEKDFSISAIPTNLCQQIITLSLKKSGKKIKDLPFIVEPYPMSERGFVCLDDIDCEKEKYFSVIHNKMKENASLGDPYWIRTDEDFRKLKKKLKTIMAMENNCNSKSLDENKENRNEEKNEKEIENGKRNNPDDQEEFCLKKQKYIKEYVSIEDTFVCHLLELDSELLSERREFWRLFPTNFLSKEKNIEELKKIFPKGEITWSCPKETLNPLFILVPKKSYYNNLVKFYTQDRNIIETESNYEFVHYSTAKKELELNDSLNVNSTIISNNNKNNSKSKISEIDERRRVIYYYVENMKAILYENKMHSFEIANDGSHVVADGRPKIRCALKEDYPLKESILFLESRRKNKLSTIDTRFQTTGFKIGFSKGQENLWDTDKKEFISISRLFEMHPNKYNLPIAISGFFYLDLYSDFDIDYGYFVVQASPFISFSLRKDKKEKDT